MRRLMNIIFLGLAFTVLSGCAATKQGSSYESLFKADMEPINSESLKQDLGEKTPKKGLKNE